MREIELVMNMRTTLYDLRFKRGCGVSREIQFAIWKKSSTLRSWGSRSTIAISTNCKQEVTQPLSMCHLGNVTVEGRVVSPISGGSFLMLGASECIIFIKWVLTVLFFLQTNYFCIGINKQLSWGLYLEVDKPHTL